MLNRKYYKKFDINKTSLHEKKQQLFSEILALEKSLHMMQRGTSQIPGITQSTCESMIRSRIQLLDKLAEMG